MCTNLNSYCVLSRRQCVFEKCVILFYRLDGCVRISTIINTSIWFAKSLCSSITEYRCITVGKKKLARLENNNVCKTKYQRLFFSIFKISYCVRQNEYSVGSGTGGIQSNFHQSNNTGTKQQIPVYIFNLTTVRWFLYSFTNVVVFLNAFRAL